MTGVEMQRVVLSQSCDTVRRMYGKTGAQNVEVN